jgi:hypothetical protein
MVSYSNHHHTRNRSISIRGFLIKLRLDRGPSTLHSLTNRVTHINQSELHQSSEWSIIIMVLRASIYVVLNYEVVVNIYQLMELLIG